MRIGTTKKPPSNSRKLLENNGWFDWMNSSFLKPLYEGPDGRSTNRPPPFFKCAICERLESHIEMAHMGKFNVCMRHPRNKMSHAAGTDNSWMDTVQISVAESILTEIRKCAT